MSGKNIKAGKSIYDQILDRICDICVLTTGIALVFLTVIFGWLVFGRYILNSTPTWVEQIALLLVVYIAFLGAAVGIHRNTHMGVSFFREISPPLIRRLFELISYIFLLVFGILMAIYSNDLVLFKWTTKIPLINLPEGLRPIPIMLCGVFVALFSIGHLIPFFKGELEISDPLDQ